MLESLRIQNYQILQDINLKLDRFVVIVGSSRSGKSAVVRALRALMTIESGVGFIRYGTEESKVALKVDGHVVAWAKGKSKNSYIVDNEKYERVGIEVPQKASDLLNIGLVSFGDRKQIINIQGQHSAPFLISETGSTISEFLGSISGLDRLFSIIDNLASDMKRIKIKIKDRQQGVLSLESKLESLQQVKELKKRFDFLYEKGISLTERKKKILELLQKVEELKLLRSKVSASESIISKHFGAIEILQKRIKALQDKKRSQETMISRFKSYKDSVVYFISLDSEFRTLKGKLDTALTLLPNALPNEGNCGMCGKPFTAVDKDGLVKKLIARYSI